MRLRKSQEQQPVGGTSLQPEPTVDPEPDYYWTPTWQDRQTYGRDIPDAWVAKEVVDYALDVEGKVIWKHIHFMATMHAENNGFYEWARPMVWRPDDLRVHQTTDRGICALNSYWYQTAYPLEHMQHVPDAVAYDWQAALHVTMDVIQEYAINKAKGSSIWDWKPILDWQWHAFGTERYEKALPVMRKAVNDELASRGLQAI
jgi:hypothetical protein